MSQISDYLPKFYRDKLPKELLQFSVAEIDKCSQCIMGIGETPVYSSDLKCCTYHPFLPNYMVGAILRRGGEAARIIREKVKANAYVLPIGMVAPEDYQFQYKYKAPTDFGNKEELLCPFYLNGGCSIWAERSSQCISFQCYSSLGKPGLELWRGLGDLIFQIEDRLSQELMLSHGYLWPEVKASLDHINILDFDSKSKGKEVIPKKIFSSLWAHHFEDIDSYFLKCYERAHSFDWPQFYSDSKEYQKVLAQIKILQRTSCDNERKNSSACQKI